MAKDKPITKSFQTSRVFNYSKGEVSLNFTLNLDTPEQAYDFKECLNHALKDVEEILDSMKPEEQ